MKRTENIINKQKAIKMAVKAACCYFKDLHVLKMKMKKQSAIHASQRYRFHVCNVHRGAALKSNASRGQKLPGPLDTFSGF